MTPRRLALPALAALALAAPPCAADPPPSIPAPPPTIPASPKVLTGVTTHFSQGWPPRLLADAAALGTATIRDSVHWREVERTPGHYTFTPASSGHVTRACAMGVTVLLGLEPRNPLYDAGNTAFTPTAQAAFAAYVRALADRWPGCLVAVEIGNEINGQGGTTGPAAAARLTAHAALLKAVRQAVKPAHPGVALLGGSVNMIATGFLARLFAAGALDWVDGIAVHPYRDEPEGVDRELARLTAAMHRAGKVRPIWVTEFSREFSDPAQAPAFYLKSIALMESAGAAAHFWYALADQPAFPTMGLVRMDGTAKPVARAYAFAARELAPRGPAIRVDHGDPALLHFRFGADLHVVWGAPRALRLPPGAQAFAADGTAVPLPTRVSETPVILRSIAPLAFGPPTILADSLHGHGQPPLGWFARKPDGTLLPLRPVDWEWTSYLGTPALPLFSATPTVIGTTPAAGTLVRYTSPSAQGVTAALCLAPNAPGMSARAALVHRNHVLWQGQVGGQAAGQPPVTALVPASLAAGETLDLVLTPIPGKPPARLRYRLTIGTGPQEAPPC